MRIKGSAAFAALTLGVAAASSAAALDTTLDFKSNFGFTGDLTFDTATPPNPSGVPIEDASGTFSYGGTNYAVTGVDTNLSDASQDNDLYSDFFGSHFDGAGALLTSKGPGSVPGPYLYFEGVGSGQTDLNLIFVSSGTAAGGIVSSVPEPASWALMIVGVGLAGASLRAQRTKRLQPAAG